MIRDEEYEVVARDEARRSVCQREVLAAHRWRVRLWPDLPASEGVARRFNERCMVDLMVRAVA